MSTSLKDIAQALRDRKHQVQLIYAFNGTGKTRLSLAFKELVSPKEEDNPTKIVYYNAFTEDLFHWDNDLQGDKERKLCIKPNNFTDWIFNELGNENNITSIFQHYTSKNLTPIFNEGYTEVRFSIPEGDHQNVQHIKISKGEESCFIWSIFYSFFKEIVETLNISEEEDRPTKIFDKLEYIFIDDPVSSLDDNHLIELAVDTATLIKKSKSNLKFIITTHNPLFYNVLYNELEISKKKNSRSAYMLTKNEEQTFNLEEKKGDSNRSFSYHLFLKQTIADAINEGTIQRYHFTLLRNLYEKTASFLGYERWSELLPFDSRDSYYKRIINFTSHSTLSDTSVAEPTDQEKKTLEYLFNHLIEGKYYQKPSQGESDNIVV